MPTTATCLTCHSQIFTDTKMLRPVVNSAVLGKPLVWSRVTRLPQHVYFNHGIHVSKGVACIVCHGEIGRMALTAKAEPLDMRWCVECHRDPGPRLSPDEALFAAIKPSKRVRTDAEELIRVHGVHAGHLTNCSTCHH